MASPNNNLPAWHAIVVPEFGAPNVITKPTLDDLLVDLRNVIGNDGTYVFVFHGVRAGLTRGGRHLISGRHRYALGHAALDAEENEIDNTGYVGSRGSRVLDALDYPAEALLDPTEAPLDDGQEASNADDEGDG